MSSEPTTLSSPVELLHMDFEGVEAQDNDGASMSTLLNQLVKESGVDPGQLANVLVSQNYVGSIVKVCLDEEVMGEGADEESVFAITSIINLGERQEPVIKNMREFIRTHLFNPNTGDKVAKGRNILEMNEELPSDVKLGLLVKERIPNMPVDLLHPSLISLMKDIETAVEKKMPYNFTHLIHWSKMYVDDAGVAQHYDLEDAWFEENAISYSSYHLKQADTVIIGNGDDETGRATGAQPIRRIYLFEYSKMNDFLEYLQNLNLK